MITVLETRDFFEGIFNTRREAEEYLSNHPEKDSCRLIDLSFDEYPIYVLEIDRGNFKYFGNKESFITYLRELDLNTIPTGKAFILGISGDGKDTYQKEETTPGLTVYYIDGPYQSYTINQDGIGSIHHDHFSYMSLDEVIKTGSLEILGMD